MRVSFDGRVMYVQIQAARTGELQHLAVRKYLDALCVFFWAATSLLFSLVTFGTYILLGNELSASTAFTSLALFNVLIAPLNAFPWVINGLVEAVVSAKRLQRHVAATQHMQAGVSPCLQCMLPNVTVCLLTHQCRLQAVRVTSAA